MTKTTSFSLIPYVPYLIFFIFVAGMISLAFFSLSDFPPVSSTSLILSGAEYNDKALQGEWTKIVYRSQVQPFNLFAAFIFLAAILHTFAAHSITRFAHRLEGVTSSGKRISTFGSEIMFFLGEIEVIFGLWVIPLVICMSIYFGWEEVKNYIDSRSFEEPLFVVVIMTIASSSPIISLAEWVLGKIAGLLQNSVSAWWFTILTVGPPLGSLITEPGAMTICAFLLARKFYHLRPSRACAYGTLGLLFTSISIGGALTNYAAPPILMVQKSWNWDTAYVFNTFGWKALIAIVTSCVLYYLYFRKELKRLDKLHIKERAAHGLKTPIWIVLTNLLFMLWFVINGHNSAILIGFFLLFLGFHSATSADQGELELKPAVLVGFFLAGLIVHGGLQSWWIEPLLENLQAGSLLLLSLFLTSFNDNAAITYLATLVPSLNEAMRQAVVAGAIAGGGLTVIANAPNPAGQSILQSHFPNGVSAVRLLLAAIPCTIIATILLYF